MIDGFEVWREGKKWYALNWPHIMEANTKSELMEMISEATPHQN